MECSQILSLSQNDFEKYASIILETGPQKALDYGIPKGFFPVHLGMQVEVHLRGKLQKGLVIEIKKDTPFKKVSPVLNILKEPLLKEDLLEMAFWLSKYYCCPLGQIIKNILPSNIRNQGTHKEQYFVTRAKTREELRKACIALQEPHPPQARLLEVLLKSKKGIFLTELLEIANSSKSPLETLEKKGLVTIEKILVDRSPLVGLEYFKTHPKKLNDEQEEALLAISSSLHSREFKTHLLFGVTGSGKTEVYLQSIDLALQKGLGTIMLVPEISLTGQTIDRLRSRFDNNIAILHHKLSQGQRFDEWHRIHKGEAKIVVGARSALFSPISNLGLIIVDEEHDGAYKQSEEAPCYHARDAAVMRGKISKATVILGSATPSLESYSNCFNGKYILNRLTKRATDFGLPTVSIVDMKREYEKSQGFTSFSEELLGAIKSRLNKGEQSILFLNRRGYHTSLNCKECFEVFKCPHCELALTFHFGEKILSCHLCGFFISPPPTFCPKCNSEETLKFKGVGTEQIERSLHAIFPEIRTLRIDRDTTKHKGSHEQLFRQFSTHKADVLIGTQMIAKGLHFPSVTLVAVLNCDSSLHIPDFRSSEQVFQLILQVSGRAGRGRLAGEVILQTQMPENETLKLAASQDYERFFQEEIKARKMFGFPPFSHFIKLVFSGSDLEKTQKAAEKIRSRLQDCLANNAAIHPLLPSGHAKIKDLFRFQFLIRGKNIYQMNERIKKTLFELPVPSSIKVRIDVDPLSTFF